VWQGLRLQAAKEAAAEEALALRQEVERVITRHQERVANWEAASAADEADLIQRKSALEVKPISYSHSCATSRSLHNGKSIHIAKVAAQAERDLISNSWEPGTRIVLRCLTSKCVNFALFVALVSWLAVFLVCAGWADESEGDSQED